MQVFIFPSEISNHQATVLFLLILSSLKNEIKSNKQITFVKLSFSVLL